MCELTKELEKLWDKQRTQLELEETSFCSKAQTKTKDVDPAPMVSKTHLSAMVEDDAGPFILLVRSDIDRCLVKDHLQARLHRRHKLLVSHGRNNMLDVNEGLYVTFLIGEHSETLFNDVLAAFTSDNELKEITVGHRNIPNAEGLYAYINAFLLDQEDVLQPFFLLLYDFDESQISLLIKHGFIRKMIELHTNMAQIVFLSRKLDMVEALPQIGTLIFVPQEFIQDENLEERQGVEERETSSCLETSDNKKSYTNAVTMQRFDERGGDDETNTWEPGTSGKQDPYDYEGCKIDEDITTPPLHQKPEDKPSFQGTPGDSQTSCGCEFCGRVWYRITYVISQIIAQFGDCCFY